MKNLIPIVLLGSLLLIGCSKKCEHDWKTQKARYPACENPDAKVIDELPYREDIRTYVFGATFIVEECKKCGHREETTIYGKEVKNEGKVEAGNTQD